MTDRSLTDDEIYQTALCVASDAIDQEAAWQMFVHYDISRQDQQRVMHDVAIISQELWERAHICMPAPVAREKKRSSKEKPDARHDATMCAMPEAHKSAQKAHNAVKPHDAQ